MAAHKNFKSLILLFVVALSAAPVASASGSAPASASTDNPSRRFEMLRDSISSVVTGAFMPAAVDKVSITKFGAKGDGVSDCRKAFLKAMAKAGRSGGMHIVVPEGIWWMEGPLTFVSNVTVELEEGAVLRFSPRPESYPQVPTSWEGTFLTNYSPLVFARDVHDVAIIGKGTIDGNAMTTFATWKPQQKAAQLRSRDMNHSETPVGDRIFGDGCWLRPHLIQFYGCERVTIEGVKIINSPFWCVHLLQSRNIVCRSLRFDAKLVNNDGIDPESSRDIIIEDIDFDNGDDNIAIKAGRDNDGRLLSGECRNILIRNCRFKGLHGVVIGSEMSGGVSNVIVDSCTARGYVKRGIYVKTNPDRGGHVRNIFVRNCSFGDVEDLFYVTSRYAGEGLESKNFSEITSLHVDGLTAGNVSGTALVIQGTSALPVSDVTFHRVNVKRCAAGLSFTDTTPVMLSDCSLGASIDVPTQITPADRIFDR